MSTEELIENYISGQPEPKRTEIRELHSIMLRLFPTVELWFLDGKNDENKIVSNPVIGYGSQIIKYANGKTRAFYQTGISANKSGISVYILGIKDKKYLSDTYGSKLGKANVSGYCIKFKTLEDINPEVLIAAISDAIDQQL